MGLGVAEQGAGTEPRVPGVHENRLREAVPDAQKSFPECDETGRAGGTVREACAAGPEKGGENCGCRVGQPAQKPEGVEPVFLWRRRRKAGLTLKIKGRCRCAGKDTVFRKSFKAGAERGPEACEDVQKSAPAEIAPVAPGRKKGEGRVISHIRDRTDDQPVEIRPSGAVLHGAEGCSVFPEGFSGALSVRAKGRDEPHPRDDAAVHGNLRLFPGYRRPRPCRRPRRRGLRGARDLRARRRCRRHGRRRATGIF